MGRARQAQRVKRALGSRQQEIVNDLRDGWRLFYEVGQTRSSRGRTFSLGTYTRTFMKKGKKTKEVKRESVCRLADRGVLRHEGDWPGQNCFDSRTRRVELLLDEKKLP